MKNIIRIVACTIIGVILLLIIMTVEGRMSRSMEISSNLPSAIEETVENMAVTKKYDISDTQEYISDFVENLSVLLDTDSDIIIDVMEIDKERGVLSIRVTEKFIHPNGQSGAVACNRTVILNRSNE